MNPSKKKAPRIGPGRERQNSVRTICEQRCGGKPLVSLTEPAIRLLKSEALLRDFLDGLKPDHSFLKTKPDLSRFTAIIGDCITIAILSAELGVTREAGLGQRIRSVIREMTRDFNRVCFDLQRGVRKSDGLK